MKYKLLCDIKNYAKKGSVSDLKNFDKNLIKEWIKIGVVEVISFKVENETIVKPKEDQPKKKINRFETPELISLRKNAEKLGIKVKKNYGMNKLNFLIDEEKKKKEIKTFIPK